MSENNLEAEASSTESKAEARKVYMRAYMAKRRAALKAGTWVPGRQKKQSPSEGMSEERSSLPDATIQA